MIIGKLLKKSKNITKTAAFPFLPRKILYKQFVHIVRLLLKLDCGLQARSNVFDCILNFVTPLPLHRKSEGPGKKKPKTK